MGVNLISGFDTDSIFLLRFYSQSPRPGRGLSAPSKAHLKDRNGLSDPAAIPQLRCGVAREFWD
jgi:hypothetical protein